MGTFYGYISIYTTILSNFPNFKKLQTKCYLKSNKKQIIGGSFSALGETSHTCILVGLTFKLFKLQYHIPTWVKLHHMKFPINNLEFTEPWQNKKKMYSMNEFFTFFIDFHLTKYISSFNSTTAAKRLMKIPQS